MTQGALIRSPLIYAQLVLAEGLLETQGALISSPLVYVQIVLAEGST